MPEAISASDLVYNHSRLYSQAMIGSGIPSQIDGFKEVHRRILTTLKRYAGHAVSTTVAVGETMGLHPHGDSSIQDTAVRMAQSFEYNPPLVKFGSAIGMYSSPHGAAARYTKVQMSEFAYDILLKGIDYNALPKKLGELLVEYEPIYYAPAIPTTLLYANNTIGYGDPSYTLPHNLGDVCDLVVAYTQHLKTAGDVPFDFLKHVEKFIPDFPVVSTITNYQELLAAYKRGEFNYKVKLDGEVRLTADTISIQTLPYGVEFEALPKKIEALLQDKGSWFDRNLLGVKPLSKKTPNDIGDVSVTVKRGVSVFEAWTMLKDRISFSASVAPIPNYSEAGYVIPQIQPWELLAVWYNARYNLIVSSKKTRIMNLTERLRETEALLIICNRTDEVLAIIRQNDREQGRLLLQERFDLSPFQATFLTLAKLDTLSQSAPIELKDRIERLTQELAEVRDSFAKIPDEIAAEAKAIKKKYPTPRRTRIPNYLGYVRIGGGCIQIESLDEIAQIIEDFPKVEMEIHMYDGPHLYKVSDNNRLETGSIPKITTGDIYGLKSNQVMTVNITNKVACCVKGFVPGTRSEGYFYTTPISRVITRDGDIRTVDVTEEFAVRKTISHGRASDVIYVYPDLRHEHYVISLNTATPNVINIQRVGINRSKIVMNPMGDVHIVHSADKHLFVNIPSAYLSRNSTRVVEFCDLDKLLEGSNQQRIDLGQAKTKSSKLIRLL